MRNMLLATTAGLALLAGVAVAAAQYGADEPKQPPAATQGAPGTKGGAEQPRQKAQQPGQMQRGAQEQGRPQQGKQDTRRGEERGGAPGGKAAQDEQPGGKAVQGKASRDRDQDRQARPQREERDRQAQPQRDERERTGQAPQRQEPGAMGQRDRKGQQPTASQPMDQKRGEQASPSRAETSGRVTLSAEQRGRVQQQVLSGRDVPRINRANFALRVGTTVPNRVRVVEVPSVLIDIHPEWRGYSYFVVSDDIIIVDRGHHIVAVMPVGTGSVADYSVEEIRQIQLVLIERGFIIDSPNGVLNSQTRQALVAFQRQQGLEPSGRVDIRTVAALGLQDKVGKGRESYGSMDTGGKEPAARDNKEPAGATPPANRKSGSPTGGGARMQHPDKGSSMQPPSGQAPASMPPGERKSQSSEREDRAK